MEQHDQQAPSRSGDEASKSSPPPHQPTPAQSAFLRQHEETISQLKNLVYAGKQKQAVAQLMTLRRRLGQPRIPWLEAVIAEAAMRENMLDFAWRHIEPYSRKPDIYHPSLVEAQVIAGRVLIEQDKAEDALVLMDWLTSELVEAANKSDIGDQNVVRAAHGVGLALHALNRYEDALDAYRFASDYAKRSLRDYRGEDPLRIWLRDLNAARHETQLAWNIERYGESFVKFREAEQLRRNRNDHDKALPIYQEIIQKWPGSPYADASHLYEALCLIRLKRVPEAEAKLLAFHKADPMGLYRGEALLELGRIALEYRVDVNRALGHFEKLDQWIGEVRQEAIDIDASEALEGIMPLARPLITPAQEMYREPDFWGRLRRHNVSPGQLINRRTAPWYLDHIEEQGAMFRGFVEFVYGNKEAALSHYQRASKLSKSVSGMANNENGPTNFSRLSAGAKNGFLVAHASDLRLFHGRIKTALLLTEYNYITQQYAKAETMAKRMLNHEFGRMNPAQQDVVNYTYGSIVYRGQWRAGGKSGDAAIQIMEKILASREGTISESKAMMAIANLGRRSDQPDFQKRAMDLLMSLHRDRRHGRYHYIATIELGRTYLRQGEEERGYAMLDSIDDKEEKWQKIAQYYINAYQNKNNQ